MHLSLKLIFILFCYFPLHYLHAESHHPQEFLQAIKGTRDEGLQIVNHFCISCHAPQPMISLGAPRIKVESDWLPRMKQSLALLLEHTEEGFNAMPPRGGCFECSDEQLKLAIRAMLPDSMKCNIKPIKTINKSK